MKPIVDIRDYAYAYPAQDAFVLRGINFTVIPGECHCITGPTGTGKSTLLQAIQGILPAGKSQGLIRVCGNGSREASGLVLQEPDMQILTKTIGQEVAFGLENLCIAPERMPPLVKAALIDTGLDKALGFESRRLSMGQKYRLILSSILVMNPNLMMFDEPSGHLDSKGLKKLERVLARLKQTGLGILICEHRPEILKDVIDRYWLFQDGELRPAAAGEKKQNHPARPEIAGKVIPEAREKAGRPVISTQALAVGYEAGMLWSNVNFDIYPGEIISVYGENGSGKTTLLRCLMGMIPAQTGQVRVFDEKPAPEKLRGKVCCLFQNPAKQLFENTVYDEVAFQVKRSGLKKIDDRVHKALSLCGIAELRAASPHKLSYGQKHLVALASVIGASPELLLLDDPFSGLDRHTKEKMVQLFYRLSRDKGTTIILTTHHLNEGLTVDRRFHIKDGRVGEAA